MSGYSTHTFSIVTRVVDEHTRKLFGVVEDQFRIRVQPKPRWLPEFLWKRILGRLLVLDRFPLKFTYSDGSLLEIG